MTRIKQIRTDFNIKLSIRHHNKTLTFICVNPLNLCHPCPNLKPSLSILSPFCFIQIGSAIFQDSYASMFVQFF
jgi:hypothetical protein